MKKSRYIYIYLNPMKPGKYCYDKIGLCFLFEPFYVGKGTGNRLYKHLTEKRIVNPHKTRTIEVIKSNGFLPIIIKLIENNDNTVLNKMEQIFISTIGRSNKSEGPLTNITPGGDSGPEENTFLKGKTYEEAYGENAGVIKRKCVDERMKKSGYAKGEKHHYYGEKRTEEVKQKISKTKKERKCHEKEKNPMFGKKGKLNPNYGRKLTPEQKIKQKESLTGRIFSENHKKHLSESKLIDYVLISPDGYMLNFKGMNMLKQYCLNNKLSLSYLKTNINKGKINIKALERYQTAVNCYQWEIKAYY